MQKRLCGSTQMELSVLGTGCWAFGSGDYWGEQNQKDVNEVVHASLDLGINYFDTAEVYNHGRSETALGNAIKGLPRDKIIIGTKVSTSNCYKNTLIEHCEASLQRLQTDYVDLYMIHWPIHPYSIKHFTSDQNIINNPPTIEEAVEALQILKKQGKIRELGISNFSHKRMKELPIEHVAVNELPYNLLCRAIEYDTLPFCAEIQVGVIGYIALFQGILTGKFASLEAVPVMRRRTRHFNSEGVAECRHGEEGAEAETNMALQQIRSLSEETGLSMTELAIQWVLANPAITCTLAGSRNRQQLEANVHAVQNQLAYDIKRELDRITAPLMKKLGNHFDYYENVDNDRTL